MRDMSNKSAKARMSKATDALEYIKNSIASGKTVYVTAGHRTTKVTPKAYAKWEASGKPLFKISSDGALLMASGSSYVRLTLADEMLARVTAMSRPGAKARFADGTDSFLTIKGVRYRIAGIRKDAKGNLVYDLHGTSKTAHPVTYTLVKFLDDQRWVLWGAQGQEVARGKMEAARPSAKAEMAIRSDSDVFDVLTEASDKGLDRHNLVREARRLRDAIDPHGVGGQAMLKHKSWPQLVRLAEQIERLPAAYARPGAKVTAEKATMAAHPENIAWMRSLPAPVVAKVREILTKPHSGARAKALRDALKSGGVSYNKWIPDASAGAEVLGGQFQEAFAKPSDLEREDVKAGLKLMEKADKAVSDKIRTLIAEGKPQDQAVAIALDMKRRGEI